MIDLGRPALLLRRCFAATLVATSLGAGVASADETGSVAVRGIVTDHHVDLPLDPSRADAPKPRTPPAAVRIAAKAGRLDGLEARVAPIEIVAAGGTADLVWDEKTGDLADRDQIVARRVAKADLAAAADRVALVRRVRELVQRAPRPLKLTPEDRVLRPGARVDLTIAGAAGRSVAVVVISGDGTVGVVHPARGDRSRADGDVQVALDAGPPFGVDQIVAVTSTRPLDDLVAALRRLDRRRAAGDVLGLFDALEPDGLEVGTQSVVTQP